MKLIFSKKNGELDPANDFPEVLRDELTTTRYGRHLLYRESVDSTNEVANRWAESGAPDGAVVFAEYQTAGKGRMKRSWLGDPEKNIMASVILRPMANFDHPGWVPLTAGVALLEAVSGLAAGVSVQLKWPNDLLLNGKKCAGILSEMAQGASRHVILGFGVNVNQERFPEELQEKATSILLETGQFVSRPVLFARILERLEIRMDEIFRHELGAVTAKYQENLAGIGSPVTVRSISGREETGVLSGIAADGSLLVATPDGDKNFYAGDVTLSGTSGT